MLCVLVVMKSMCMQGYYNEWNWAFVAHGSMFDSIYSPHFHIVSSFKMSCACWYAQQYSECFMLPPVAVIVFTVDDSWKIRLESNETSWESGDTCAIKQFMKSTCSPHTVHPSAVRASMSVHPSICWPLNVLVSKSIFQYFRRKIVQFSTHFDIYIYRMSLLLYCYRLVCSNGKRNAR